MPLEKWKTPPLGVFKINIDIATVDDASAMGLGVVIRDSRGHFVAARTRKVLGEADAMRVEAMAIREGLSLAKDLEIRAVILEGDAKIILENFENS